MVIVHMTYHSQNTTCCEKPIDLLLNQDLMLTNVTSESPEVSGTDPLLPSLGKCFSIVIIGYLAGRFGLIRNDDTRGMKVFISSFSLPSLIFLNLATLDLAAVNWYFIAGIFMGKSLTFLLVVLTTVVLQKPVDLAQAGLYGMFCTQGNDFGLAYPLVSSLYKDFRPTYPGYLYLVSPISLMVLNPVAFLLMEVEKFRNIEGRNTPSPEQKNRQKPNIVKKILLVLWRILKNPNVLMTILGLTGNLVFHGKVPYLLNEVLQLLSSAFAANVLFLLGFSVAGRTSTNDTSGRIVLGVLLVFRMLGVPLLISGSVRLLCGDMEDWKHLTSYAFLYGTVPTGPVVLIFAAQYGLSVDMTCVLVVLLVGSRWRKQPHVNVFSLVISQVILGSGILFWTTFTSSSKWFNNLQSAWITYGQLTSRIWTAIIAVVIVLHQRRSAEKFGISFLIFGFGMPALVTVGLLIGRNLYHSAWIDEGLPIFLYGKLEVLVSVVNQSLCLFITFMGLILFHRHEETPENFDNKTNNETINTIYKATNKDKKDIEKPVSGVMISKPEVSKSVNNYRTVVSEYFKKIQNSVNLLYCPDVKPPEVLHGTPGFFRKMSATYIDFFTSKHFCSAIIKSDDTLHLVVLIVLQCVSMATSLALSIWKLAVPHLFGPFVALSF
ncbi:lysosomal cholesterol signaling protein-like isoform X2 [Tachypleus tridentatus]|uniref:lysosomal cholesterol signaling protein-like isoform X2 n=1 Tax=Tachypleus tridentatus TaxID=6853 RepID=UPI003FD1228F